jgi:hypothetical protein
MLPTSESCASECVAVETSKAVPSVGEEKEDPRRIGLGRIR